MNEIYTPAKYWRVKAETENGGTTIFWAFSKTEKKGLVIYVQCKRDGEKSWFTPTCTETKVYIGAPESIIWERPARMSKKYAMLEVVKSD